MRISDWSSDVCSSDLFCGTFDSKGCQTQVRAGRLEILQHGRIRKLVQNVAHITFSGQQALLRGQRVLYVTERATFELTADGVELIELAPGVELQRDVLSQMDFKPVIREIGRAHV